MESSVAEKEWSSLSCKFNVVTPGGIAAKAKWAQVVGKSLNSRPSPYMSPSDIQAKVANADQASSIANNCVLMQDISACKPLFEDAFSKWNF